MFFDKAFDSYSYSYPNYQTTTSSTGASPTNSDSASDMDKSMSPTQLLSMAINKRRRLTQDKDRDFRRELLHTTIIQALCKHIGENRAKMRRHKRRPQRRRAQQKRRWSEEEEVEGDSGGDQEVPSDPNFAPPPTNTPDPENGFDSAVQNNGTNGGDSMMGTMVMAMEMEGPQPTADWDVPLEQPVAEDICGHGLTQISAPARMNGDNGGPTQCKRQRLQAGMAQRQEEVARFALSNLSKNCSDGGNDGNDTVGHGLFKFKWPYRNGDGNNGCEHRVDMVMLPEQ